MHEGPVVVEGIAADETHRGVIPGEESGDRVSKGGVIRVIRVSGQRYGYSQGRVTEPGSVRVGGYGYSQGRVTEPGSVRVGGYGYSQGRVSEWADALQPTPRGGAEPGPASGQRVRN